MTLEEFGASLRAERENKGITLDDVANRLKIGVRMLRALEEGDRENFPHVAYAKGFIRSYAAYLGMSDEEIRTALSSLTFLSPENIAPRSESAGKSSSVTPLLLQIGVLLLVIGLVAGAGYAVYVNGWATQAYNWVVEKTEGIHSSDSRKENQKQPATPVRTDEKKQEAPLKREEPKEIQAAPQVPAPSEPALKPVRDEVRTQAQADTSTPATQPAVNDSHQVVIVAVESCWIHSTADGKDTRQFSLRKGDTFALSFRDRLEVKLGNAGGVRFRYNGQDIPPVGKAGQVRTVTFPSGAVQ